MELQYQSSEIDKLVAASVAAELEYAPFQGTEEGNRGNYASLDDIKKASFPALHKNGLTFKQFRMPYGDKLLLKSILMHTSGQWMASYAPIFIAEGSKDINQAWGSTMTYQRRYEAYGFLGLGKGDGSEDPDSQMITEAQYRYLMALLKGDKAKEAALLKHYEIQDLSYLPREYMEDVLAVLQPKK